MFNTEDILARLELGDLGTLEDLISMVYRKNDPVLLLRCIGKLEIGVNNKTRELNEFRDLSAQISYNMKTMLGIPVTSCDKCYGDHSLHAHITVRRVEGAKGEHPTIAIKESMIVNNCLVPANISVLERGLEGSVLAFCLDAKSGVTHCIYMYAEDLVLIPKAG
jgi:hypothetical protein